MKVEFSKIATTQHNNISFAMHTNGFVGEFRIAYLDNTRKNARFKDLYPVEIYFCGIPEGSSGAATHNVTDAMIFAERKMAWILQEVVRQKETEDRDAILVKWGLMDAPK